MTADGELSSGSIISLLGFFGALLGGFGHNSFDFVGIAREALAEKLEASFGDNDVVHLGLGDGGREVRKFFQRNTGRAACHANLCRGNRCSRRQF